jgi:hypothetical protein
MSPGSSSVNRLSVARAISLILLSFLIAAILSFIVQLRELGLGPNMLIGTVFPGHSLDLALLGLQLVQTAIVVGLILVFIRPRTFTELMCVAFPPVLLRCAILFLATTYYKPAQDIADFFVRLFPYIGVCLGSMVAIAGYRWVRSRTSASSGGNVGPDIK